MSTTQEQMSVPENQTYPEDEVLGGVVPYFCVDGAVKAAEFYVRAFGATEVSRVPVDEKGRTMHIHLYINGGSLMMSDPYPEYGHPFKAPEGITIHMKVADVDASWKRAVNAGCTVVMELADMFWGDRYGQLKDPFGFMWSMGMPIRK